MDNLPESGSRFWNSSKITHTLTQTYISLTHRLRLLLNKLFSLCLKDSINYFSLYLINSFYFSFRPWRLERLLCLQCLAVNRCQSLSLSTCKHCRTTTSASSVEENRGSWNIVEHRRISTCFNSVSTLSALVLTHSVWHAILLAAKVWFRCSCLILRKSGKLNRNIDMYL